MRILVTYWSRTGNTKKVAEAIFDALPMEKSIMPIGEITTLEGIGLTFLGFPVMRFGPPPAAIKFLKTHAAGKKIALFVTHAMISDSEEMQHHIVLDNEIEKCRSACSKSELVGLFHCMGELSEKTADELMASNIPMLIEFAMLRPFTIGHPDPDELEQSQAFARKIMESF